MSDTNGERKPVILTDKMVHDLMNHLTSALGHSELLALELAPDDPQASSILEICEACRKAVDLVNTWSPRDDLVD